MPEGVTNKFGTGAVRSDTCEQYRYDLITPIGLREVARTCAEGAAKYDDYNWEKGMPVHDLLNHAIAHVYQFLAGDRSEPHLPHAAWNLLAAIHSDQLWPELNAGTLRGDGCCRPLAVAGRGAEPATPGCTHSRREVMEPVGLGEPAESRYAFSGRAVEVVPAGEHEAASPELRKRGYTQSQAEPWKWFAPVKPAPLPPPDVAAIRERARKWAGPFTPTYRALADDILALADALEQATAGASGGNEHASTAEK